MNAAPTEYNETVLAHFRAPRNAGRFPSGAAGIAAGRAGSRRHGREISLELRLGGDGRLEGCRYRVYGCPATVALCSLLSEKLEGLTPIEAQGIGGLALAEELGLPAEKREAALLLEDALRAALAEYNMHHGRKNA